MIALKEFWENHQGSSVPQINTPWECPMSAAACDRAYVGGIEGGDHMVDAVVNALNAPIEGH